MRSWLPGATLTMALPLSALVLRNGPHGSAARRGSSAPARTSEQPSIEMRGEMRSEDRSEDRSEEAEDVARSSTSRHAGCDDARGGSGGGGDGGDGHGLSLQALLSAPWARDPTMLSLLGMNVLCLYIINGVTHMLVTYLCAEVGLSLSAAGMYSSLTFALSLAGIWSSGASRWTGRTNGSTPSPAARCSQ